MVVSANVYGCVDVKCIDSCRVCDANFLKKVQSVINWTLSVHHLPGPGIFYFYGDEFST